jgi:PIN domain nuclease of toxin-antitoxin system
MGTGAGTGRGSDAAPESRRLLVAQAEVEALTLVTRDRVFERSAVERILA